MTIRCQTLTELAKVCADLVREGVTFEAQTHNLTITLTGGF
jgi:hypothetical protein